MTCELCYSIAYYAGETAAGSFAYRVCDEKKGSLGDLPADLPGDLDHRIADGGLDRLASSEHH